MSGGRVAVVDRSTRTRLGDDADGDDRRREQPGQRDAIDPERIDEHDHHPDEQGGEPRLDEQDRAAATAQASDRDEQRHGRSEHTRERHQPERVGSLPRIVSAERRKDERRREDEHRDAEQQRREEAPDDRPHEGREPDLVTGAFGDQRGGHVHEQQIEGDDDRERDEEVRVRGTAKEDDHEEWEQRQRRHIERAGGGVLGGEAQELRATHRPLVSTGDVRVARMRGKRSPEHRVVHGRQHHDHGYHPCDEDAVPDSERCEQPDAQELERVVRRVLDRNPERLAQRRERGVLQSEEGPRDRSDDVQHRQRRMRPEQAKVIRDDRRDQHEACSPERRRPSGDAVRHQHHAGRAVPPRRQEAQQEVGEVEVAERRQRHHRRDEGAVAADGVARVQARRGEPEGEPQRRPEHRVQHQAVRGVNQVLDPIAAGARGGLLVERRGPQGPASSSAASAMTASSFKRRAQRTLRR